MISGFFKPAVQAKVIEIAQSLATLQDKNYTMSTEASDFIGDDNCYSHDSGDYLAAANMYVFFLLNNSRVSF